MALKYAALIAEQGLAIDCPSSSCKQNESMEAARWVVAPIDSDLNFLPNHLYDAKRVAPARDFSDKVKCERWGMSFHTTSRASKTHFRSLNARIRELLGYTHVAEGVIEKDWGLISEINPINLHFSFYENDGANWLANFQITAQL